MVTEVAFVVPNSQPLRILITGAFGNIGSYAAREIASRGHLLRCFDRPSAEAECFARSLPGNVETAWGDIRDAEAVGQAVRARDVVLHLAAIIPPLSEEKPDLSNDVNVGGTRNVIEAVSAQEVPPRLVYVSSIAVFGPTQHLDPPRRASDPVQATDHYTSHKIECESRVRESGLTWAIIRMGAAPPVGTLRSSISSSINPMMFDVPLTDRIEFIHPADGGLAIANAAESEGIWGKTLLLGGGPRCQLRQGEFLRAALEASGIGMLPAEAFATKPFHTDWLDTTESQALLQYQRHTLDGYLRDLVRALGARRHLARVFRPWIRRAMLRHSPYWIARTEPSRG